MAPASRDDPRGLEQLLARLDRAGPGDQREVLAADLRPPISKHRALAVLELRRGELVGLEDRDDLGDAGGAVELEPRDVLAVADRADQRHLLAAGDVGAGADAAGRAR